MVLHFLHDMTICHGHAFYAISSQVGVSWRIVADMSEIANIAPKIKERATSGRLGRNVRYIMDERGISQTELARRLGLSESQVSRRIGGGVKWTPADIEDTADALGVDIGLLFKLKLPPIAPGGGTQLVGIGTTIKRSLAERNNASVTGLGELIPGPWPKSA
jgi:transcriptional regulator with XRE-family HTH domain